MLKINNTEITDLYINEKEIIKVMLNETVVFEKETYLKQLNFANTDLEEIRLFNLI